MDQKRQAVRVACTPPALPSIAPPLAMRLTWQCSVGGRGSGNGWPRGGSRCLEFEGMTTPPLGGCGPASAHGALRHLGTLPCASRILLMKAVAGLFLLDAEGEGLHGAGIRMLAPQPSLSAASPLTLLWRLLVAGRMRPRWSSLSGQRECTPWTGR